MGHYQSQLKVGYLGGGQLARMLAQSAFNLGLEAHVLSENADDPAAQVTGYWTQGSLKKLEDLKQFLAKIDVATFESEFLDADLLMQALADSSIEIFPHPQLMGLLQDRKSQKALFDNNKLPSSPWTSVDNSADIEEFVTEHSLPVVFKKRVFGYDGYGTFVVRSQIELDQFIRDEMKPDLFIVEKFIPFQKECAVIIARSQNGSFCHFPFVESFQKDSRCDWIKGPLKNKELKPMLNRLKKFLNHINYVGVMGVEFFMIKGQLLINEIAPRVHNTGHYSLSTAGYSQFDIHNLCLAGEDLPKKIEIKNGFAMANLIGSGKKVQLSGMEGLYWYGKKDNRMGRKMGHINALGKNPSTALKQAIRSRKDIQL